MIKDNIFWSRAIDPFNGRLVKEPTMLGAVLLIAAGFIIAYAVLYVVFFLLQFV